MGAVRGAGAGLPRAGDPAVRARPGLRRGGVADRLGALRRRGRDRRPRPVRRLGARRHRARASRIHPAARRRRRVGRAVTHHPRSIRNDTPARAGSRRHQSLARQHPPQLARVRRVPPEGRRRHRRRHLEPDHLPEGDRRLATTTTTRSARPARRVVRGGVLRAGDQGRPGRRRPAEGRLRADRPPRRLRLVRAAARAGQRRGRVDRRRAGVLEADRPAQHLHQDPRHRRGRAGDRGVDRGRHQRQRHAAVLAASATTRSTGRSSAGWSGGSRRASRSTTCTRWRASSSPGWTPPSTSCCREGSPLAGKAAVANAKMAYQQFLEITASDRWKALEAAGARVQRPLWASTGTKNPAYSDVLYVESLIGPAVRQHDARPDDRRVHGPRHRGPHGRRRPGRGAAGARPTSRRPGSRWTTSPASSRSTASRRSRDSFDSLLETIEERLGADRGARRCLSATAENPLRTGLRVGGATEPALFTIFGATGDLSQRKLLPAIYNLAQRGLLPAQFAADRLRRAPRWTTTRSAGSPGRRSRRTRGRRSTTGSGRPFAADDPLPAGRVRRRQALPRPGHAAGRAGQATWAAARTTSSTCPRRPASSR